MTDNFDRESLLARADGTSPATDVVSFVLVFGGFALACMI